MTAIALLGSGEFEEWARPVDAWCVEQAAAGSGRVLVVPTASAPEGDDVFSEWAAMGIKHYQAIGLKPEVLALRERADASNPAIVDAIAGASLVFFSGGNPGYLAETLVGTPFWATLVDAVARGETALGGCSAGVAFLGNVAPFVAGENIDHWSDGTKLLPNAYLMPHFNMLDTYIEGLRSLVLQMKPAGSIAIGLDENTAMYGDGERWQVAGAARIWVGEDSTGELAGYRNGDSLDLNLLAAPLP
jgi:cyanophycinase